tara:strand:- start:6 stop:737 length:732 start_codon:yes stop_codon:yes gene_type:complete
MVSVDTVYQKVLALANKEQRGYITPQDFNLFANQAQMEIFEQYFYDTNIARKSQGNDTVYADVDEMLEEKIQIFDDQDDSTAIATYGTAGTNSNIKSLPDYIYRVHRVEFQGSNCEMVNTKDFRELITATGLLAPTNLLNMRTTIVNIRGNTIRLYADGIYSTPSLIFYIRVPSKVNWTYVVINKQAMYDANNSTQDFELHASEENQLVNKILRLAGVSNQQPDIMRAGAVMDQAVTQQQPKI